MSKIALVTGASSGIGREISVRLAKDGYTVLVHYNANVEGAQKTLTEVKKYAPESGLIQFDISSADDVKSKTKDIDVEVLVNNAGVHLDGMAMMMSAERFEKVLSTNLTGPFLVTKACAAKMLIRRSGCIVNISSLAGQIGNMGQVNYSSAKAGVIAMTKTLARELGPRGIRVNAIAPGLIETEMISSIPNIDELKKQIPLGRFGRPQEVAGVVSFLCSPDAGYINGHTISVNGGLFPS